MDEKRVIRIAEEFPHLRIEEPDPSAVHSFSQMYSVNELKRAPNDDESAVDFSLVHQLDSARNTLRELYQRGPLEPEQRGILYRLGKRAVKLVTGLNSAQDQARPSSVAQPVSSRDGSNYPSLAGSRSTRILASAEQASALGDELRLAQAENRAYTNPIKTISGFVIGEGAMAKPSPVRLEVPVAAPLKESGITTYFKIKKNPSSVHDRRSGLE